MRKLNSLSAVLLTALALISSACSNKTEKTETTVEDQTKIADATKADLEQAVADRDELLSLVSEISNGLSDIKNLESIVTTDGTETPSQKAKIRSDIEAIQKALTDRRQRLAELEKKLSASNVYTSQLSQTIESMKKQIESQTQEINNLNAQLADAKAQIGTLNTQVDSLHTTVTTVTEERNTAQAQATDLTNQLNTVYIAFGTNKQLKSAGILQKKFLSKTKVLDKDFDHNAFVTADKRTYKGQTFQGAKKAKIVTNQPANSYTLVRQGDSMVLTITNPEAFWANTSYLVVTLN